MNREFRKANTLTATLAFVFAKECYMQMAVNHSMAINLEANDLKKAYEAGTFPKSGWESESLLMATECAKGLSRSFYGSLIKSLSLAVVAVAVGALLGKIHPSLDVATPKIAMFFGLFLATWGALIQMNGVEKTFCGEALHENVHAFLSGALFVPGAIMAFIGAIW